MDDKYAINLAKTEIREAFDTANPGRLLAVLDESFISHAEGRRSAYGERGKAELGRYLKDLFDRYDARLVPIIIEIQLMGSAAVDYGWHELTLIPKRDGEPVSIRTRYVDIWRKDQAGNWKLAMFMDNADIPDQLSTTSSG